MPWSARRGWGGRVSCVAACERAPTAHLRRAYETDQNCIWSEFWYVPPSVYEYDFFSYESKADFHRRSEQFWNPDKTRFWQEAGVDLVIDRREGYCFWDMAG